MMSRFFVAVTLVCALHAATTQAMPSPGTNAPNINVAQYMLDVTINSTVYPKTGVAPYSVIVSGMLAFDEAQGATIQGAPNAGATLRIFNSSGAFEFNTMGPPGSCSVKKLPATSLLSMSNPQAWIKWASFVGKVVVNGETQNMYRFFISAETSYELWSGYNGAQEAPRRILVTYSSPTDLTVIDYSFTSATYGPVNPSVFAIPAACADKPVTPAASTPAPNPNRPPMFDITSYSVSAAIDCTYIFFGPQSPATASVVGRLSYDLPSGRTQQGSPQSGFLQRVWNATGSFSFTVNAKKDCSVSKITNGVTAVTANPQRWLSWCQFVENRVVNGVQMGYYIFPFSLDSSWELWTINSGGREVPAQVRITYNSLNGQTVINYGLSDQTYGMVPADAFDLPPSCSGIINVPSTSNSAKGSSWSYVLSVLGAMVVGGVAVAMYNSYSQKKKFAKDMNYALMSDQNTEATA